MRWGLGHAVLCAKHLLNNEPFAALLPDVLVLNQKSRAKNYSFAAMMGAWNETGIGQVMVEQVSLDAPSNLAVLGRYILPSKVLDLLETTVAGIGGEIQLTDALDELLKHDGLNAFETDAGIFDCGNKQGFLSTNLAVGMRDPETKQVIKELIQKSDW